MARYWRRVVIEENRQEDFDRMENLLYDPPEDINLLKC
jgi:hypothetical protein